jgi:hypothetical protein
VIGSASSPTAGGGEKAPPAPAGPSSVNTNPVGRVRPELCGRARQLRGLGYEPPTDGIWRAGTTKPVHRRRRGLDTDPATFAPAANVNGMGYAGVRKL